MLFPEGMKNYKKYFLNKFMKSCYLIDTVKCPIDKLPKNEKAKAIASCTEYLKREMRSLKFKSFS